MNVRALVFALHGNKTKEELLELLIQRYEREDDDDDD